MRFDGHYKSTLVESTEWHAGTEHVDRYYRYIKFFPGARWLWVDRGSVDFDFEDFLDSLDIDEVFDSVGKVDPPVSVERDHGHLYERGTVDRSDAKITLSFPSVLADMTPKYVLSESAEGFLMDEAGTVFTYIEDR